MFVTGLQENIQKGQRPPKLDLETGHEDLEAGTVTKIWKQVRYQTNFEVFEALWWSEMQAPQTSASPLVSNNEN